MNYLTKKARQLTPYVAGFQPGEPDWVKLNTNENPYFPSPKVAEAIANANIEQLRLYPDGNCSLLREAIAERNNLNVENIFCGNGSDEVLALAYQAFFSGRHNILTPDISYGFYPVWSQMYDVTEKIIPVENDYSINAEHYKNGNGVIIANPNAPTSKALSQNEIEQIVKQNPAGVVLIDEAYIDFTAIESAVPLIDKYENLLVVQTFSKSYSLAGLRVGYAMGSKILIDGLQRIKDAFNSYPLGMLEQKAAAAAILDVEYWNITREKIILTRDKTIKRLQAMGYEVFDSHTNFIFFKTKNEETAKNLYEHLLKNKILVRYWQKPRLSEFLRVSIGTDNEMEAFIKCVKQF
jgi:histidinol-phosphate aminotransferase